MFVIFIYKGTLLNWILFIKLEIIYEERDDTGHFLSYFEL
jgi:hypothetical protein